MSRAHAARAASVASRAEATEVAATRAVLVMVVHRCPLTEAQRLHRVVRVRVVG